MSEPILEVEDLTIEYTTQEGQLTAVSDASFTISPGETVGLVGESGCGKSTLAKSILGALDPNGEITGGRIVYDGTAIQDYTEAQLDEEIRWKEIAWIPQSSMNSLDPIQTVEDKALEIADAHTDLSEEAALEKFRELVEIVGIQESRLSDYPYEFSGGMQQRIVIALALFLEPSILIADEPTTALDVIMQDTIFGYLDEIKERLDTSILLITHDISVVFESADRMVTMHGGQVAERGTVEELHRDPRHPYSILLQNAFPDIRDPNQELETIDGHPPRTTGAVDYCTFADRCPWAVEECRQGAPPIEPTGDPRTDHAAACIRKEEVHELYEPREAGTATGEGRAGETGTAVAADAGRGDDGGDPLLSVRNLEKYFEQRGLVDVLLRRDPEPIQAVDGVSFAVPENHTIGIIGESGCGKTTLLKTLIGLHTPTGGEIRYRGTPMEEFGAADWSEFRGNVQIIFQDPFNALDPKFTVEEVLAEQLDTHDVPYTRGDIVDQLEQVELRPGEEYLDRTPDRLSGGEKQRVSIARALAVDPELILADEPVSMLDVSTQTALLTLLDRLIDETGTSMVYISHDLSTVSYVCDEIHVMYLGRTIEKSATRNVLRDPKHPYTRALIGAVPIPDPTHDRPRTDMDGSPRDPVGLGDGCRFRDRCPERMEVCEKTPREVDLSDGDERHVAACHLYYDHEDIPDGRGGDRDREPTRETPRGEEDG